MTIKYIWIKNEEWVKWDGNDDIESNNAIRMYQALHDETWEKLWNMRMAKRRIARRVGLKNA